jgi:hypothetical protein
MMDGKTAFDRLSAAMSRVEQSARDAKELGDGLKAVKVEMFKLAVHRMVQVNETRWERAAAHARAAH